MSDLESNTSPSGEQDLGASDGRNAEEMSEERRAMHTSVPHVPSEARSSPDSAGSSIRPRSSIDEEAPLSFSSASDRDSLPPAPAPSHGALSTSSSTLPPAVLPPQASRPSIPRPVLGRSGSDPHFGQPSTSRLPLDASTGAASGPSPHRNRMRYADPDQHWLSEDEGSNFSRDVRRHRRQQRRGSGPPHGGGGSSDGKDSDPDKDQSLYLTGEARNRHPISNKPATISNTEAMHGKDSAFLLPDMASVTPNLLSALECPTCTSVMQDPITLVCGHSLCLTCSVTESASKNIRETPPFAPLAAPTDVQAEQASEGEGSGITPLHPPDWLNTGDVKSKTVMSDAICPVSTCRKVTKARSGGRMGLRTDYVLQKLTTLLQSHLKFADDDAYDSGVAVNTVTLDDATPLPVRSQLAHHSSPDEEVKGEDTMKRIMGRKRPYWQPNKKKARSGVLPSPSLVPTLVSDMLSELECQVCVTLLYEPLTAPCGHTFCKRCLFRSLDHSSRCPLCRTELPGFGYFLTSPFNQTLINLLVTTFPLLYEERRDLIQKEEGDSGLDTPVFVCMVAFPHMPTNLHIYEPRYRLMMRRALDTNKRFGMVLPSRNNGGFSQYGTMLEIKNIQMFDDGRSLVETVGVYRFRILESGTLDGYNVGRVERVEDIPDEEEAELERLALARSTVRRQEERERARAAQEKESLGEKVGQQHMPGSIPPASGTVTPAVHGVPPPSSLAGAPALSEPTTSTADDSVELTNKQLLDECKNFVEALRTGSTPWLLQRLSSSLPPMPEDAREFTWWMAMLMPVDDHEKAKLLQVSPKIAGVVQFEVLTMVLLQITSYRLRLRLLVFWIQQMQGSWWFSRGCAIC